jgi:hypothetical protein
MRERGKLGFRARSVIAATRRMLDDGAIPLMATAFPTGPSQADVTARRAKLTVPSSAGYGLFGNSMIS